MEGQNRYFFKLLLGEHTDLGKRGLKLKLSSARSYWGSSEVSNFDMCPVGKLFRTQKMMKITKIGNIALLNLFCQRAAIGVENRVEDHRRQNSLPEMPRKPRYKSLNSVTKRQRKYKALQEVPVQRFAGGTARLIRLSLDFQLRWIRTTTTRQVIDRPRGVYDQAGGSDLIDRPGGVDHQAYS